MGIAAGEQARQNLSSLQSVNIVCPLTDLSGWSVPLEEEFMKRRRRRNAFWCSTSFFYSPPFLDRGNPLFKLMVCSAET